MCIIFTPTRKAKTRTWLQISGSVKNLFQTEKIHTHPYTHTHTHTHTHKVCFYLLSNSLPQTHTHTQRIIERFDEESYWVVAEICAAKNDKHRGVLIRKFIKTAHYCFLHNNFYSLFSILGALGFHQVKNEIGLLDFWGDFKVYELCFV